MRKNIHTFFAVLSADEISKYSRLSIAIARAHKNVICSPPYTSRIQIGAAVQANDAVAHIAAKDDRQHIVGARLNVFGQLNAQKLLSRDQLECGEHVACAGAERHLMNVQTVRVHNDDVGASQHLDGDGIGAVEQGRGEVRVQMQCVEFRNDIVGQAIGDLLSARRCFE